MNMPLIVSPNRDDDCSIREQDRFMPIANVIRIMRRNLPSHAKIADDAKETIQECVSEYISFITSEANERCQREQRKTITAEDILYAMSKLGFDDYIEPLTLYLHRYREVEGDRGGNGMVIKRGDTNPGFASRGPNNNNGVREVDGYASFHIGPSAHQTGFMIGGYNFISGNNGEGTSKAAGVGEAYEKQK